MKNNFLLSTMLVASSISFAQNEPINFEDWWVDPDKIGTDIIEMYQDLAVHGDPKYYHDTLFRNTD